ncbi:antitoxin Xre/MbcA/ParS toxin-binding domain-containing protein [Pseudomonas sp. NFX1]|uniref:antitoxin Xre/MbcA/ParS toxin-binding domain-containing protein n=1 Tax=Pseudomonas sp. NFX1 TaxID=2201355 RepID=UPI003DA7A5AC
MLKMTELSVLVSSTPFLARCWSLRHRCFMTRREQILTAAEQIFGNRKLAEAWFTKPAIGLGRRLPCMLLETSEGYAELADFLIRLDYGVY